jgi:hypothetical protein
MDSFVKKVLDAGGDIIPLIVPANLTNGTGLFNPSIYNDNGNLVINVRHCQYTLYHAEKNLYEHEWGPLVYLNPENDITLTTTNFFADIKPDFSIDKFYAIDTSKLDVKPIWEFVGLEDCRLVRWDGKLYISGVRRDTTPNGQGRMELSEIIKEDESYKEISRFRIPAPRGDNTYCEKNWMPVVDLPYHYVKWCNPTEVVKVDPITKTCETVYLDESKYVQKPYDYRGGSQVITVGDYYVALTHVTYLYRSEADRKDATYRQAFVVWDKNWNVVKYCEPFSMLNTKIEFCCGMTLLNGKVYISFGVQDNAAYLLSAPLKFIEDYING